MDKYDTLFWSWFGLMIALVLLVFALAFLILLPGISEAPNCESRIAAATQELPASGIQFIPGNLQNPDPAWRFQGITGERRSLPWLRADFDLLRVYFRRADAEIASVWVAYQVRTPEGQWLPEDAPQLADALPGQYQVMVSTSGPFVTSQGFDCAGYEDVPFCLVESSFLPGTSQVFIESGFAPNDPTNGFMLWSIQVEEEPNLCGVEGKP